MLSTHNYAKFVKFSCLAGTLALLGGCGSSSNTSPPLLTVDFSPVKALVFSWESDSRAEYYQLLENPDGNGGFPVLLDNIPATSGTITTSSTVSLYQRVNAKYMFRICQNAGCESFINSKELAISDNFVDAIGYVKASNADANDNFGESVSLGSNTLAVGASDENSNATGVGGDQSDDSTSNAGAVYLY